MAKRKATKNIRFKIKLGDKLVFSGRGRVRVRLPKHMFVSVQGEKP